MSKSKKITYEQFIENIKEVEGIKDLNELLNEEWRDICYDLVIKKEDKEILKQFFIDYFDKVKLEYFVGENDVVPNIELSKKDIELLYYQVGLELKKIDFKNIPYKYKHMPDVFKIGLQRGDNIKYIDPDISEYRDACLIAVNGGSSEYTGPICYIKDRNLLKDREICLKAGLKTYTAVERFGTDFLNNDEDFFNQMLNKHGIEIFKYLNKDKRNNPELVLEAIKISFKDGLKLLKYRLSNNIGETLKEKIERATGLSLNEDWETTRDYTEDTFTKNIANIMEYLEVLIEREQIKNKGQQEQENISKKDLPIENEILDEIGELLEGVNSNNKIINSLTMSNINGDLIISAICSFNEVKIIIEAKNIEKLIEKISIGCDTHKNYIQKEVENLTNLVTIEN